MSRETGDDAASTHGNKRQRLNVQPPREKDAAPPELVEDLITEILSRLPVKSLLRFRCVCKCWKSLICSSNFVKKHLHQSATDPNLRHHRLLGHNANELRLSHSVRCFLFDNPSSSSSSPFITLEDAHYPFPCTLFRIVGSCNGLVCWANIFYSNGHFLFFLNPSTRLTSFAPCLASPWRAQPRHSFFRAMLGFGYDHVTDTYKTLGIYCDPKDDKKTIVKVYAFGDSSWRTIQSSPFVPRRSGDYNEWCGKFVSGTLNWLAARSDGSLLVVSVDLGKETWSEVLLPDVVDKHKFALASPKLWVLGDCLCFSYDFKRIQFALWQMKEFGVRESWTKLLNFSYLDVGIEHHFDHYPRPLFILNEGQVLLQIKREGVFILYDPRNNTVLKYLQIFNINWCEPRIHIESLVSPQPVVEVCPWRIY